MTDLLDGVLVSSLTPLTILGIVVMLILLGKLIPRRTFEDFKAQMNDRLAEAREDADKWEQAYRLSEAARVEQGAVLPVILEMGKTQSHLLQSIHERAIEKQ